MGFYERLGTSLEMQNLLDAYFIELFELGEKKTVNQIGDELHVNSKTIYRYISYCAGYNKKNMVFNSMMNALIFKTGSLYSEMQQKYFEQLKLLDRKKKSLIVVKELLLRQKSREVLDVKKEK